MKGIQNFIIDRIKKHDFTVVRLCDNSLCVLQNSLKYSTMIDISMPIMGPGCATHTDRSMWDKEKEKYTKIMHRGNFKINRAIWKKIYNAANEKYPHESKLFCKLPELK